MSEKPLKSFENTLLEGRYRLTRHLSEGNFGAVFQGQLEIFEEPVRDVAVKITKQTGLDREKAKNVFGESILLAKIWDNIKDQQAREYIVPVYDMGILEDYERRGFIVMALISGDSSKKYATPHTLDNEIRSWNKGMPPEVALKLFRQICDGMAAVHDLQVVHRDLKPDNILLTDSGEIRIVDFGLAAGLNEVGYASGNVGTFRYMAPETSMRGKSEPNSDVYSLGIILYEMLTCKYPFEKIVPPVGLTQDERNEWIIEKKRRVLIDAPSTLNIEVEPWLDGIVLECLKFSSHERPRNGGSLLELIAKGPDSDLGEVRQVMAEVDDITNINWRKCFALKRPDWLGAAAKLEKVLPAVKTVSDSQQFYVLTKLALCYINLGKPSKFNEIMALIEPEVEKGRFTKSYAEQIDFYEGFAKAVEKKKGMKHYAIGYRIKAKKAKESAGIVRG